MNWDRIIGLLCYGIGQGVRLAETDSPYKIGQHTEALRQTIIMLVRELPEDKQQELIDALAQVGIPLDLRPRWQSGTEAGSKP